MLRCTLADGTSQDVPVPAVPLAVGDPPEAGRPVDWRGAIGPLHVQLLALPERISLGESVHVSVAIRGAGNLWVIDEPFAGATLGSAEIYHRPPEIDTEAGERLSVRRFFRMDLVPHAAGVFEIPTIALPYYDPIDRRYATARTEPKRIQVDPRAAAEPPRSDASHRAAAPPVGLEAKEQSPANSGVFATRGVALAAAAALIAGAALWRVRGAQRRRWQHVTDVLAIARGAAERGDSRAEAANLSRALDAAVARAVRRDSSDLEAAHTLARELERIRFGPQSVERPDRAVVDAVLALIETLRTR
jgi:hypothetical protein